VGDPRTAERAECARYFVAAQSLGLEDGNRTGDSGVFVLGENVGREASTGAVTTIAAVAQNLHVMALVDGDFYGAAQAGSFDSHWFG